MRCDDEDSRWCIRWLIGSLVIGFLILAVKCQFDCPYTISGWVEKAVTGITKENTK